MTELSPPEWLRSALMDLEESRRVVACRPEFEAGVRALVAELGIGGLVEVRPAPMLPDGTAALIFDPNAIGASARQVLQRGAHEAYCEAIKREYLYLWAVGGWRAPVLRSSVIITGL